MKKLVAIGLIVLATVSALAHAQDMSLRTSDGSELGVQISNYRYEEKVNGNFFMSNEGAKFGFTGSLTSTLADDWYVTGDARYAFGNVNYTGSGTKTANPDQLLELRITAGRDFEAAGYLLSPYAGLGVRALSNDLRGSTSTGAAGYRRDSRYTYLPLGVTHRFHAGAQSRVSTSLEYDVFIEGYQLSHTTDFGAATDLKNSQKKGYGMRLNVAYETAQWSAGIFFHYWDIEDSEPSTYLDPPFIKTAIEPHNTTNEVGVQLKYRFN
jgi:hypothetical protein